MSGQFSFSADQIDALASLLGGKKYIPAYERMVGEFREASSKQMSIRSVSKHIGNVAKFSTTLRTSIEALQREYGTDARWILEPLALCEQYSQSLIEYQYSGPLPAGRPREFAKSVLIRRAASHWRYVLKRKPKSLGGDFPFFIQLLLEYSKVPGAVVENLEELIDIAKPNRITLRMPGPGYPFEIDMDKRREIPQPRRAAEDFFSALVLNPQEPAWPKRPTRAEKKQMGEKE